MITVGGVGLSFLNLKMIHMMCLANLKNRSLQEMARTMLHENNLAKHFWVEAVNTACYVQNRIYIRPLLNKTAYELFKGRKPNISYFH